MNTITPETTVGELVRAVPARSRVFENLGIDYCCGGKKPLIDACRAKGLDPATVVAMLAALEGTPDTSPANPDAMTLSGLCDHIEQVHHAYLREELPRLDFLTRKVAAVHGEHEPRLHEVRRLFGTFQAEIAAHTREEDERVFPAIRQLESVNGVKGQAAAGLKESFSKLESEHNRAGAALARFQALTDNYAPPDWACNTFRGWFGATRGEQAPARAQGEQRALSARVGGEVTMRRRVHPNGDFMNPVHPGSTMAREANDLRAGHPMDSASSAALTREILELKHELKAVILAHNYQVPEIQDLADFVGDSLGLARQAAATDAEVIIFCGVHFMAETAKILNPDKLVLLPDANAGCSLEASCPAAALREVQASNPNFYTIAYVNCSAEVKALSDVICTSGNAVRIVEAAPADRDLLFVPDENLGAWVMGQTGRPMTLWRGNCYAHVEFRRDSLLRLKAKFPEAKVVVHPESLREVRDLADAVCSTEKMITYCRTESAKQFVIVTESGIIHRMRKECPGKEFICAPTFDVMRMPADNCRCSECRYMKMNTLEKLRDCTQRLAPRIELPQAILEPARRPIERMLEISAR